jgi:D-alanyl-D-alanine carboxypeptidase
MIEEEAVSMRKWVFCLVLLFMAGYGMVQYISNDNDHALPGTEDRPQGEILQQNDGELTLQVTKEQIYKGHLLLVNKDYPVPKGAEPETVRLSRDAAVAFGFVAADPSVQLTPILLQSFAEMVEAARQDGVDQFMISSGYRDLKKQRELYEEAGPDYALPAGYSEHNLGLSLDIGSTQGKMEHAAEGQWLKNNAWKYGFILRYPEDKTAVTGIRYEPWHFRYVGLPHSAIMQEKQFVLEEYLDYLREQKSITATIDQQVYEIFYYPVSQQTAIRVPANSRYEISGNNVDGVIVTVYSE